MLTLICWLLNLKLSEIIMFFFLFTSVYLVMFSGYFQFLFSCYVSSQQFRGSFQYRPFDWSAGSLGSLANAERKGSCLCQSVQVKKKKMAILLVCHGICLTQNDSKEFRQQAVLPFQRSQSCESGGKGEKDVSAARETVGVRCTYKMVSTFYAFQSQIATRYADIYIFFVPFFFFFSCHYGNICHSHQLNHQDMQQTLRRGRCCSRFRYIWRECMRCHQISIA